MPPSAQALKRQQATAYRRAAKHRPPSNQYRALSVFVSSCPVLSRSVSFCPAICPRRTATAARTTLVALISSTLLYFALSFSIFLYLYILFLLEYLFIYYCLLYILSPCIYYYYYLYILLLAIYITIIAITTANAITIITCYYYIIIYYYIIYVLYIPFCIIALCLVLTYIVYIIVLL